MTIKHAAMKANSIEMILGIIIFTIFSAISLQAAPTAGIFTDQDTYYPGDVIDVSLSARNFDPGIEVDVYIGLITPDDGLYLMSGAGWSGSIQPWITSLYIPFPFNMNKTVFFSYEVPCENPPIEAEGNYLFAVGLAFPGQFAFVNDIGFAPFEVGSLGIPQAFIDLISPNPAVVGEDTVQFSGHGVDADGTIVVYEWRSDLDGLLSEEREFEIAAADLTLGTHSITFKVKDDEEHWSKVATAPLTVREPNELPEAYILSITPLPAFQGADSVIFRGLGIDADGLVSMHEWTSDIDGFLGEAAELVIPASELTPGTHTISFRVQDDLDEWSSTVNGKIEIVPEPGQHLYVDANSGDDGNDGSELSPMETITHALQSAEGSPTSILKVHVAQGEYSAATNGESFPLSVGDYTILMGRGAGLSVLNAAGETVRVISCSEVQDVVIAGFTITGGNAQGSGEDQNGGGILCSGSSAIVMGNTIVGNTAGDLGGGIFFNKSTGWVLDNQVAENSAAGGGGIHCYGCSPTLRGNLFLSNVATSNGGGVYCYAGRTVIENCWIVGNSAESYGGGIRCNSSGSPTIKNTLFTDNHSQSGALACNQGSSPTLINCTFTSNTCSSSEGGIYFTNLCDPIIENCIIWGNQGSQVFAGSNCDVDITYSDIMDGFSGDGNIDEDPQFAIGSMGGTYLSPGSPCVDSGARTSFAAGLAETTTQVDGTPDSGLVDMGYHYPLP
ncbi:MAG: right-handed parallel beta-helix repeat-containing protein [Candidatus Coatesbacteria bacterium]|nr:right-handed parallel beta-helix repeat-containing protein [Candidatus Coatesbacteria bacterium]